MKHGCARAMIVAMALLAALPGCKREGAGAGAAAGAKGGGGGRDGGGGGAGPAAVPVVVVTAALRDVPDEIRTIGAVEPLASVVLRPQVPGQLLEVRFEDGQDVRAGDLLMVLDERPYQAALAQAQADLARSEALAQDAVRASEQMTQAAQKRAISQRESEQFAAASAAAAATVKANQAAVERARLDLEYCRIVAPISGRTGKAMVKRGTVLEANKTDLVEINQMEPMGVGFSVPERLLPGIREAQRAEGLPVAASIPGRESEVAAGTLTFIDNRVDMTTGTIRLRATFPNTDRKLWPGQFVNVGLTVGVDKGAVVIPQTAVMPGQRGQHVFIVKPDQTVELRPVTVKRTIDREVVISAGLVGGESVVSEGQLRLMPGTRVDARPGAPATTARGGPSDDSAAPANGAGAAPGGSGS